MNTGKAPRRSASKAICLVVSVLSFIGIIFIVVRNIACGANTYPLILLLLFSAVICLSLFLLMKAECRRRMAKLQEESREMVKSAGNKSDFLSRLSHDIRTPLGGIIGMSYLARKDMDDKEALDDELSKIQSSAAYLLALVNNTLDVSKIESGKMSLKPVPVNIEKLFAGAYEQFRTEAEDKIVQLKADIPEFLPNSYVCDKLRLRQILGNLLSNAVKFTSPGGLVSLSLSVNDKSDGNDIVSFSVKDTGIGMSEEFMSRIFLPFEQQETSSSSYGGTGLGLSIVKSLTELMQGNVAVKSKLGKGSCFTVELPLKRCDKINEETEADVQNDLSFDGQHILLVEDHPINAQIVMTLLTKYGLQVDLAENGKQGLESFIASAPYHYSMIFMDIRMPEMDGCESARRIRASGRVDSEIVPIYAMSANAFDEDVKRSLEAGMNGHLRKPIEIPELNKVLLRHLGS